MSPSRVTADAGRLLLRGAADDDPQQHPPPARPRGRAPARDHHQPRPDDAPGDLADLGRPGDRGPAGRRRGSRAPRARSTGSSACCSRRARARATSPAWSPRSTTGSCARSSSWSPRRSGRRPSPGAGSSSAARAGASRPSRPTRTTRSSTPTRPDAAQARAGARLVRGLHARGCATPSPAAASPSARAGTWPPTPTGASRCATGSAPSRRGSPTPTPRRCCTRDLLRLPAAATAPTVWRSSCAPTSPPPSGARRPSSAFSRTRS